MKIKLEIECGSVAFEPNADFEAVTFLRAALPRMLAEQMEHPKPGPRPLRDANGNMVGTVDFSN